MFTAAYSLADLTADVSFIFDCEKGYSDIQIENGDIKIGDELQTAVEMSMFTDARALTNPEPRVRKTIDALRGWWADAIDDEVLGSLYWIYSRRKQTQEVLNGVAEAFRDSLQWLIDDGVASVITVVNEWADTDRMNVTVTIEKPNDSDVTFTWGFVWDELFN